MIFFHNFYPKLYLFQHCHNYFMTLFHISFFISALPPVEIQNDSRESTLHALYDSLLVIENSNMLLHSLKKLKYLSINVLFVTLILPLKKIFSNIVKLNIKIKLYIVNFAITTQNIKVT